MPSPNTKKSTAKKATRKRPAKKKTAKPKPEDKPQEKSAALIPPDIAERLLKANLANIVKKVKAGKTLTREERRLLTQASEDEELDGVAVVTTYVELAEILGITRRTLQDWRKMEGAPEPASNGEHDVNAWKEFQSKIDGKGAERIEDPEEESGLPSEPILKRKKLLLFCQEKEMQLSLKRGELIEISAVRNTWAKKCAEANTHLRQRLENELPSELEGLEAADIFDALVAVVDEFNEIMNGGKGAIEIDPKDELSSALKKAKQFLKTSEIYALARSIK